VIALLFHNLVTNANAASLTAVRRFRFMVGWSRGKNQKVGLRVDFSKANRPALSRGPVATMSTPALT
jgi:hypothetical protein